MKRTCCVRHRVKSLALSVQVSLAGEAGYSREQREPESVEASKH